MIETLRVRAPPKVVGRKWGVGEIKFWTVEDRVLVVQGEAVRLVEFSHSEPWRK